MIRQFILRLITMGENGEIEVKTLRKAIEEVSSGGLEFPLHLLPEPAFENVLKYLTTKAGIYILRKLIFFPHHLLEPKLVFLSLLNKINIYHADCQSGRGILFFPCPQNCGIFKIIVLVFAHFSWKILFL